MSAVKSGKQVGDEMSLYSFRPGPMKHAFPRGGEYGRGRVLRLFDKGHFRVVDTYGLNDDGGSILIRGKTYGFRKVNDVLCPEGFTPVPEKTLLQHYGSRYTLNVRKMERALEDYRRECIEYRKLLETSVNVRRPRAPTLRTLYLERATEFERYLRPYISVYHTQLKANFPSLVRLASQMNDSVYVRMNRLYESTEEEVGARFAEAGNKYICVRLSKDFEFDEPSPVAVPAGVLPYNLDLEVKENEGSDDDSDEEEDVGEESDDEKSELELMREDEKLKSVEYACLFMKPWKCYRVELNPYKSDTYRHLYLKAQLEYENEFANFNRKMQREKQAYEQAFDAYFEMKRKERDATVDLKSIRHVDRPQARNFTREWNEFIFVLLEKMRKRRIYTDKPIEDKDLDSVRDALADRRDDRGLPPGDVQLQPDPVVALQAEPEIKIVSQPLETVQQPPLKPMNMKPVESNVPRVPFFKPKLSANLIPEDPDLAVIMKDNSYSKGILMI